MINLSFMYLAAVAGGLTTAAAAAAEVLKALKEPKNGRRARASLPRPHYITEP